MINIPAVIINRLIDALSYIFWYKRDLETFLKNSVSNKSVFLGVNWNDNKKKIVSEVIDNLLEDSSKNMGDIKKLLNEVSMVNNFSHLEHLEDGDNKVRLAKNAVSALKEEIINYAESVKREKLEAEKRLKQYEEVVKSNAFLTKLDEIKHNYYQLTRYEDKQKRGYELEKIMYELFELFDLDPKASFKNKGEQIDGAFSLDGIDYLIEVKWTKKLVDTKELDAFVGKINRKLDNTLGLFLSINGFSDDAVEIHSKGRSSLILMDGIELVSVLENQIDLKELLIRKRRYAAQTGQIYYRFQLE